MKIKQILLGGLLVVLMGCDMGTGTNPGKDPVDPVDPIDPVEEFRAEARLNRNDITKTEVTYRVGVPKNAGATQFLFKYGTTEVLAAPNGSATFNVSTTLTADNETVLISVWEANAAGEKLGKESKAPFTTKFESKTNAWGARIDIAKAAATASGDAHFANELDNAQTFYDLAKSQGYTDDEIGAGLDAHELNDPDGNPISVKDTVKLTISKYLAANPEANLDALKDVLKDRDGKYTIQTLWANKELDPASDTLMTEKINEDMKLYNSNEDSIILASSKSIEYDAEKNIITIHNERVRIG